MSSSSHLLINKEIHIYILEVIEVQVERKMDKYSMHTSTLYTYDSIYIYMYVYTRGHFCYKFVITQLCMYIESSNV